MHYQRVDRTLDLHARSPRVNTSKIRNFKLKPKTKPQTHPHENALRVKTHAPLCFLATAMGNAWSHHCCKRFGCRPTARSAFKLSLQRFPTIMLGKPFGYCSLFWKKIQKHILHLSPHLNRQTAKGTAQGQGGLEGHKPAKTFLATSFAKSTETHPAVISARSFLDGPSARLDAEGTLANQVLVQFLSSNIRSSATRLDAGAVLALPEMLTSRVALLSMYITHGRWRRCLFQILKQTISASSSASKMTVDRDGYPRHSKSLMSRQKDMAEICSPLGPTSTPPIPQGHPASVGSNEASVNRKKGTSHHSEISRGFDSSKLCTNSSKQLARWQLISGPSPE